MVLIFEANYWGLNRVLCENNESYLSNSSPNMFLDDIALEKKTSFEST